jgi:hypothetical protein
MVSNLAQSKRMREYRLNSEASVSLAAASIKLTLMASSQASTISFRRNG